MSHPTLKVDNRVVGEVQWVRCRPNLPTALSHGPFLSFSLLFVFPGLTKNKKTKRQKNLPFSFPLAMSTEPNDAETEKQIEMVRTHTHAYVSTLTSMHTGVCVQCQGVEKGDHPFGTIWGAVI